MQRVWLEVGASTGTNYTDKTLVVYVYVLRGTETIVLYIMEQNIA